MALTSSTKENGSPHGQIEKSNRVYLDLLAGIIFILISYFIFF